MNKKSLIFLGLLLVCAVTSTGASYASYRYHKIEGEVNEKTGRTGYRKLAPLGFDTVLSPVGVFCDCFIRVDTPTGNSTITTSIVYEAVAVNTLYLFVPLAFIYILYHRKRLSL